MDPELKRRVEALRRPLELAAADNFSGVRKVTGLGHALRAACDGLLGKTAVEGLEVWRATLTRWESLDEHQQAVEVARGMRLIARMPRAARPPEPEAAGRAVLAPKPAKPEPKSEAKIEPGASDDPLAAPTSSLPGIGPS